mgnify:FL=1
MPTNENPKVSPVPLQQEAVEHGSAPAIPIVGICSSAGGLDALTRFFGAAPSDSGAAFVVVPHLDPNHESMMVELLSRHTKMTVVQATEGAVVEANHVYIIPPNKFLTIKEGAMQLSVPTAVHRTQTAIDAFLRSLAVDQLDRAIAIILSGTGSHGVLGLKEIKFTGGMVMAQVPESAEFDAMPRNAIATGMVDYVLAPEEMPAALIDYVRHWHNGQQQESESTPEQLYRILAILRARTNYDFRSYRKNMLLRRVQRRMSLCHLANLLDYQQRLRDDPAEVVALYKDLLIGVTAFFREPEAFQVLEQQVIPKLLDRVKDDEPLRVWIPACATGEEAYSIAMLLFEALEAAKRPCNIQIFATDLDEEALDLARHGVYPDTIAGDVSEARLHRFFSASGEGSYQVSKQLRDSIVFAQQSLIGDAPFSRIDLLSCRNLLIYLEPELQAQIIRLFHFALKDDSYLLLGPSESIGRESGLFDTVSKKWRVYRRLGPTRHDLVTIPLTGTTLPPFAGPGGMKMAAQASKSPTYRYADLAHRMLLDDYAPASVLINSRHQIYYHQGPTVDYLEFPSGEPTTDLLAISRPGLRTRVRAAVLSALETGETIVDDEARVKRDGHYVACRITVKPAREPKGVDGLLLVSFEDRTEAAGGTHPAKKASHRAQPIADESRVVTQLESELKSTREDLQSTIEELEGSNEELKASNEEVMSMNEELQSANEELETSKEELQSMNEELNTVNVELQTKVHDLEGANNDITNLLSSTDIATLFLDDQLRIKLFTPPTGKLLSLIATDIGRPIGDFSAKVANDNLIKDVQLVIDDLVPIDKEVWTDGSDQRCYLRRIVPYRTADSRIEGVVITFIDITERKRSEAELEARVMKGTEEIRHGRNRLRSIVETAVDGIVTMDLQGTVDLFNPSAERMFGYRADEVIGRNVKMLMPPPYAEAHDGYLESYLRTGKAKIIGIGREVQGKRKDGTVFPVDLAVAEIGAAANPRFVGTMRDLTEIKRAQEELKHEHALSNAIVSTARVIILRLDQQGRIVSFNNYMEELCGFRLEEVKGKDWFDTFIPKHEHDAIKGVFARAIRGAATRGNINTILTKSGAEVLVEWYDNVLQVHGEPFTLLAVGQNVTERDRLEKEFVQAQKMEAIGRLAGGVAHDFNNLLAGITGGLRVAAKDLVADHPARQMLDQVVGEVNRGSSITRRLLDFSRIGKSKTALIDPREALAAGEGMIRRFLGEDVAVRVICDSSRSRIHADASQLEQAVLNLAINSRDAMPQGGRLDIRCSDLEVSTKDVRQLGARIKPGPFVAISVEDSGCGMDERTRKRALEAFFTTKEAGLGTGLGLSSVSTMVEQGGGCLEINSKPEVGTTVRMLFPRVAEGVAAVEVSDDPKAQPPTGKGEVILLVEDATLVRLGVQHVLERLGYVVLSVKDPEHALKELKKSEATVDLLLTDVVLPGMSGPELADAVKGIYPEIQILFMSAFPTEELIAQKRVAPGTITLEKPFGDEQLAEQVRKALANAEP